MKSLTRIRIGTDPSVTIGTSTGYHKKRLAAALAKGLIKNLKPLE